MFKNYLKTEEDTKNLEQFEEIEKLYNKLCQQYFNLYPKDFLAAQLLKNTLWVLYKTKGKVNPFDFYDFISQAKGSNQIVQDLIMQEDKKYKKLNKQVCEWFLSDYFNTENSNTYSQLCMFRAFFNKIIFELSLKG